MTENCKALLTDVINIIKEDIEYRIRTTVSQEHEFKVLTPHFATVYTASKYALTTEYVSRFTVP